MKRLFDFTVALAGLILASPLMVVAAIAIKLTSHGPVLFRQERMGKEFRPFKILKFRTMASDAQRSPLITAEGDTRITWIGRLLRKTKVDELPQFVNVLKGEMSIVGPRPEVAKYVEMFRSDYNELLRVRPGITDLASIKYRNESELLGQSDNPELVYVQNILPDKIKLGKEYVRTSSMMTDLNLIFRTLMRLAD